mgnify:CR=1 FL=1
MQPEYLKLPEEVTLGGGTDVQLRALSVNGYAADLKQAITKAVEVAGHSPCQKSKRGAVAFVHIELRPDDAGKWVPVPFDRDGKPKGPSCISCARDILCADARIVWLWGVDGWRWWYAQDFLRDTLDELKLVDPSLLPRRIGTVST